MTDLIIRKATLEDIPHIYGLVYELAVFEKEPEGLKIAVSDFQDAFNENIIDCIVFCDGDKIVGMTIFYMTFSTWRGRCLYLEDFYIQPDYRRGGWGQKLFDAYIDEAKALGCYQAKWQVLDWNEVGLNFYIKNNATIEKNWWNGKLYFDQSL